MVVRTKTEGADSCSSPIRNYSGRKRCLFGGRVKEPVRKVTRDFGETNERSCGAIPQGLDFIDKRERPVIDCMAAGPVIGKISELIFSPVNDRYHNNL
ncbi:hypothetical protein TNCV_1512781 [Trichonephila clavipes]|nr:hypothetical protein TNCV_1512781 [Trichonephila clavipes]